MTSNTGWNNNVIDMKKKEEVEPATVPAPEGTAVEAPKPPEEKMTHLDIFGPISRDTIKPIHSALNVNTKDEDRQRLFLTFSSNGGQIDPALFIDSLIETWPLPSVAVCGSMNASAATFLIAKRDLRLAYPNSRFMLHDSKGINDGSILEQEERLRSHKDMRQRIMDIYIDFVGLTKKEVERIVAKDSFFNAMDAMNLGTKGLIDGIILKNLGRFKFEVLMHNGVVKTIDLHKDDYIQVRDLTVETVKGTAVNEVKEA